MISNVEAQSGLKGLQVQLVNSAFPSVGSGFIVVFNNIITNSSSNIVYNPVNGIFSVGKAGSYYISWMVNVDGAEIQSTITFGIATSTGQTIISSSMVPFTSMQLSGSALINMTSAGTFSLKNQSLYVANYGNASVQANLVVIELST